MVRPTIFEAKTDLSELIKKAQAGETVVITSGKEKRPVARLEAFEPKKKKRLGFMQTPGFVLGDAFFEPLPEEELTAWEGEEERKCFSTQTR